MSLIKFKCTCLKDGHQPLLILLLLFNPFMISLCLVFLWNFSHDQGKSVCPLCVEKCSSFHHFLRLHICLEICFTTKILFIFLNKKPSIYCILNHPPVRTGVLNVSHISGFPRFWVWEKYHRIPVA